MRRSVLLLTASSFLYHCAVDDGAGPPDNETGGGAPTIASSGASTGGGLDGGTGPGGATSGGSAATGATAGAGAGSQGSTGGGGAPAVSGTTGMEPAATTGGAVGGSGSATTGGDSDGPGSGLAGTGGATSTGGVGENSGGCPAGFESELPLVLSGDTVPGNVELGLASSPEVPRAPCGTSKEQDCFNRLNAERARAGLGPLKWDGDLADLARSHAADRSQRRYPGSQHGSSTSSAPLYEQRAEFLGLKDGKFWSVVENSVTGASTAAAAVGSWMGSSGHAAVILGQGAWGNYTYAACAGDGREWNIEFGRTGGGGSPWWNIGFGQ